MNYKNNSERRFPKHNENTPEVLQPRSSSEWESTTHEVTPCCGVTPAGLFWYLRAAAPAAGHSAWPRMWGTD